MAHLISFISNVINKRIQRCYRLEESIDAPRKQDACLEY